MIEDERQKVIEINRELMVADVECSELDKKIGRIRKKIWRRKKVIDELLDKKET